MIRTRVITSVVSGILEEMAISHPPVDVWTIAQKKGALIVEEPLENEEFSGFLFRSGTSQPVIGVNQKHTETRRRFTIAHELGHLLLHAKTGVHVDSAVIRMRNLKSAQGSDVEEMEANRFAAELLMPSPFLEQDVLGMGRIHADDDMAIGTLARRYLVSPQAMTIRLSNLGHLRL